MATSAKPNNHSTTNVLRIGILQNGKMLEERLLRQRGPVTVGQDAYNTFVIPGDGTPQSVALFEWRDTEYVLVFDETMQGKVTFDEEPNHVAGLDFAQLKKHKNTQAQGAQYKTSLPFTAKGRIKIGTDVTLFFQFVPPPKEASTVQLPQDIRGSFVSSLEPFFTAALAGSFFLHLLSGIAFSQVEAAPTSDLQDLQDLMARVQPPKIDEDKLKQLNINTNQQQGAENKTEEPKPTEDKTAQNDKPTKTDTNPNPNPNTGAPPAPKGPSREEIAAQIASKGMLAVVGAKGGGSTSGIGSSFGAGSTLSGDLKGALSGTAGVGIGSGSGTGNNLGGINGGTGTGTGEGPANIGKVSTGTPGKVDTGTKTNVAKLDVKVSTEVQEAIEGKIDKKLVAGALRRRQDAFQTCYEDALKSNSKLRGKLTVEFTIDGEGKVTDARIVKDGIGSGEVSGCVLGVLRRIRFPKPGDNGEVTIQNAFVFEPNN